MPISPERPLARWLLLATTSILLAGTIGVGVLHGRLSNRWGPQGDAHLAARRLTDPLPPVVGNWRVRREAEIEQAVLDMLQCPAYVSRVYDHQQTGDVIAVAVLLGPPGPISVHTPEICYSSHDYAVVGARSSVSLADAAGGKHSFWEVRLKSSSLEEGPLRVLYGWSAGDWWSAAENPRFGYAGLPHLYKLQLASAASPHQLPGDFDPYQDFLSQFLPQLATHLVKHTR